PMRRQHRLTGLLDLPVEGDAGGVEHAPGRLRQLRTDAVAGDQGYAVGHGPDCSRGGRRGAATRYHRRPRTASLPEPARVKIQEADAKSLLVAQGLPVPPWAVAHTPAEARAAAERFLGGGAGKVVVKAQVLVGGRGKAGGVKLAGSADEAERLAAEILALEIKGIPVRKVLVGPAADIVKEYYLSIVLDRGARKLLFIGSAEGGVEIEQTAETNPDAITYLHADPLLGVPDHRARRLAFAIGFGAHWKAAAAIATGLYRTMLAYD